MAERQRSLLSVFVRRRHLVLPLLAALSLLSVPATAGAVVDVRRDAATGAITIASAADATEQVTLERDEVGGLRVRDASGAATSSDASCAADPVVAGAMSCTAAASGVGVTVTLGAGNDTFDATTALGTAVVIDGGLGSDRFTFADSSSVRITDATGTDVLDLSGAATAATRVRYESASARVVVRCATCPTPFVATLPAFPGTVLLGSGPADIDLTSWRGIGSTTWVLGEGNDRFFGSAVHKSIVNGGAGNDKFVSRAATDKLIGGVGHDRFADFGGRGDVLNGGAGIDMFASLDGQKDSIIGGVSLDMCARPHATTRCDLGFVSGIEATTYLPYVTVRYVLSYVGIK